MAERTALPAIVHAGAAEVVSAGVNVDPNQLLARYLRPGTLNLAALPPLSLYVHLPWCLKKCPYCDFNSHEVMTAPRRFQRRPPGGAQPAWGGPALAEASPDEPPFSRYLDALRCDLEAALPFIWGRRIHTVFIGGGTPSLFPPERIEQLINDVRARLPLEPGCEITQIGRAHV